VRQQTLDDQWAESEAAAAESAAELRAYLVGALARVNASPAVQMFVAAVYRHTITGSGRWWRVTHRELCGLDVAPGSQIDPLTEVIRCSERTIKRVTGRARELGLVEVQVANGKRYPDGGERERLPGERYEYRLNEDGIKTILGLKKARGQIDPATCQIGPLTCQSDTLRGQIGTFENCTNRNIPDPVPDRVLVKEPNNRSGTGSGAPRLLDTMTDDLLRDTGGLLGMYESLCEVNPIRGWTDCPADRLAWVGAAVYALRCGKAPVKLFRWLVRGNYRSKISAGDEDQASRLIREWEVERCLVPQA
jgi:hypothetical protein